jgi:transcriptional regulator of acetoin/glycerol metabolism
MTCDLGGPRDTGAQVAGMVPALAASWERSQRHGLRRQDRALFNNVVTATVSRQVEEENRWLRTHANPEMQRLYASLGCARWLALCVNTTGQIVSHVGERSAAPREIRVLMQPGRRLLEAELGTTAPGCVLEERRPVIVVRGEHYLHELDHLFCASAPIVAPDGSLAGALDITGCDVRALPLASDMVGFAVRRIENSMVADLSDCTLLHFHRDERLLGTPFEAQLAIDREGRIRGANRTACQLLSLRDESGVGVALASVFEGGLDQLLRRGHVAGETLRIRGHDDSFTFTRISYRDGRRGTAGRSVGPRVGTGAPVLAASADRTLVCEDAALLAGIDRALRIARSGLPVILEGETGTGKEMIARALHQALRPQGPFLALNCSAIPESLIEAELFGYVDGAFTGGRRGGAPGKLERAHGGTLLLDEIGDMPLALQGRLLRVLQERTVTRIGDDRECPVDLLVLSATHRRLEQLVAEGRFREDLYYRLNGYTIVLPPLRERTDVRALADRLAARWMGAQADDEAARVVGTTTDAAALFTPGALVRLEGYSWPGNVRQLEQTLRALIALRVQGRMIDVDDLPPELRGDALAHDSHLSRHDGHLSSDPAVAPPQSLSAIELDAVRRALREHGGNVSAAARALGVSRSALYAKMRRHGLESE